MGLNNNKINALRHNRSCRFDQNGERRLDVTNAMKYAIWLDTVAHSEAWQIATSAGT